jgi:hypothetical protein
VLVRVIRVVLLGHVVEEQAVRERLVAVRMDPGDVDRDRVLLADVLGERLACLQVEHDDAHHALDAGEEIVLAALVVVETPDHASAREREVRLLHRLRQLRRAHQLREPATLVVEAAQRDPAEPVDHLFTPFWRTKSLTS